MMKTMRNVRTKTNPLRGSLRASRFDSSTETVQEADAHTFFLLSFLALAGVALLLFLGSGTCGKIVSLLLR